MQGWIDRVPLVVVLACALAYAVFPKTTSILTSNQNFSSKTDAETYKLEVSKTATEHSVRLRADVRSGTISWTIKDPSGAVRWEMGELHGDIELEKSLDVTEGEWLLEVRLQNASGDYMLHWAAR